MTRLPFAKPRRRPKRKPKPLQRPGSLSSRGSTKQGKPRKAIKAKPRPKDETLRTFGTPEHRAWMKQQPCAFCGIVGYSDAAHVRNGGMSRRADWEFTVPACRNVPVYDLRGPGYYNKATIRPGCHHDFDHNKKTWRAKFDTDAMAARYAAEWRWELAIRGDA